MNGDLIWLRLEHILVSNIYMYAHTPDEPSRQNHYHQAFITINHSLKENTRNINSEMITLPSEHAGLSIIRASRAKRVKPTESEIEELRDIFGKRWLSVETLKKLEESTGKKFKRGKFSRQEKQVIRNALEEFCKEKGLGPEDFIEVFFNAKQQGGQRYNDERFKKVFVEVAEKLEGRPVLLVYQCMRRMFHPGNQRGRWTKEDDDQLQKLFLIHGPDWETIGITMGRYGMSVRDRFRLFRNRGRTGAWTEEEVQRLKDAVYKVRGITGGASPCWLLVSEHVGTRSVPQCIIKWGSILSLQRNAGKRATWTRERDYELISRIYDLAVSDESEIRWRDLVHEEGTEGSVEKSYYYFQARDLQTRFKLLKKRVKNADAILMDELLETLLLSLRPLSSDIITSSDDEL